LCPNVLEENPTVLGEKKRRPCIYYNKDGINKFERI
jgi:hypothetical protein